MSVLVTRRGWALLAGTATTLLLSAWVSAAGPVGIFARQGITGAESSAPGEEYGTTQADNSPDLKVRTGSTEPPSDIVTSVITWLMTAVLVAVVVVLLVVLVRAIRDRIRVSRAVSAVEDAPELTPDVLLAAAREGEEALEHGTPANAVIAAWVTFEEAITRAGIHDNRARTPAELVTVVLRSYAVDEGALQRLADLYREARFSSHEVREDMRERARAALGQVVADLRRAVPAVPVPARAPGRSR